MMRAESTFVLNLGLAAARHRALNGYARLPLQMTEGFDETAAVCALQRAGNNIGKCREYLDAPVMKENFKESAAVSAPERGRTSAASERAGCVAQQGVRCIHEHT